MYFTHEIQPGETVDSLARRFDTTPEEIFSVNDIPDRDRERLRTHMVIRIPVPMLPPTVPARRPFTNYSTRMFGNLLYVLYTDRMFYNRRQPVQMTLVKTNVSSRPVNLTYRSYQRYNFAVRRGSRLPDIWESSHDVVYGQHGGQRITLQPGQSQVFRATWDQRTNDGRLVGSGMYTVYGENTAESLNGKRIAVRIRIV